MVYRMVTCGTVEERMYLRQVWKSMLSRRVVESVAGMRRFSRADLVELLTLYDTQHSHVKEVLTELQAIVSLPDDRELERFLTELDTDGVR